MTLLSGNPDGFALFFKSQVSMEKGNRLTTCCPLYHEVWLNFVS